MLRRTCAADLNKAIKQKVAYIGTNKYEETPGFQQERRFLFIVMVSQSQVAFLKIESEDNEEVTCFALL